MFNITKIKLFFLAKIFRMTFFSWSKLIFCNAYILVCRRYKNDNIVNMRKLISISYMTYIDVPIYM